MKRRELTSEEREQLARCEDARKGLSMSLNGFERRLRIWFGRQNPIVQQMVLGLAGDDPKMLQAWMAGADSLGAIRWGRADKAEKCEERGVVARLGPDGIRRVAG